MPVSYTHLFVNPPLAGKIGRKATIVSMSALIPLMWLIITWIPPVPVLYAAFVLLGIGRGSVSIINNAVVNDNSDGKPAALNLLHMTFAVGAFLSPFLTSLYIGAGMGLSLIHIWTAREQLTEKNSQDLQSLRQQLQKQKAQQQKLQSNIN